MEPKKVLPTCQSVDHLSPCVIRPTRFNPHPLTSYLLKTCEKDWKEYTEHEFVRRIGDGTLPKESFIHYMKQDYLFLQTYARAHGLGAFKAKTMAESQAYAEIVVHIAHESKLHIDVSILLIDSCQGSFLPNQGLIHVLLLLFSTAPSGVLPMKR